MATIPRSNAGRTMPGRVPGVRLPTPNAATAQAIDEFTTVGGNIAARATAQDTANQNRVFAEQQQAANEERRRQEAVAEAQARARDLENQRRLEDSLADEGESLREQIMRGEIGPDALEAEWSKRSEKVLGKGREGFRPHAADIAMPALTGRVLTIGNVLRRAAETKGRQDVTATMRSELERLGREYATDPAKATARMNALLDTMGPASDLNPKDLQATRQKWLESAQYVQAREAVALGRSDPAALARAEAMLDKLPDLDPTRRAELQDRVSLFRAQHDAQTERRAARAEAAAAARMRTAEAEFRSGMALAQEGILDPSEAERRLDAMRGTPYQQAFRQMLEQQRKTGPLAAQPVAGVRQALDAVNAQIARGGITEELAQQRETLGKVAAGQERDIASMGGLRAAAKRGVIVADQPLNFGAGMAAVGDQLRNRVLQADMVRGWAGTPQSPLYPEEAEALATMLASADPVGFGQTVGALGSMVPAEQMAAIARQIDAKDKGLALALVAGSTQTTEGRTVAEIIRRGQQAVKDKAPETKGAEATALQEALTKAIGDALPARLREDAIEAARLVYFGQKAAGRAVSVNGAVQLALGGPIIGWNGKSIPVPAGMTQYDLRDRLEAYPRAELERQAADGWILLAGARPIGVPEFLAELPSAQLEPAGRGRYTVRMNGSLALNKDRRPLVIEVTR